MGPFIKDVINQGVYQIITHKETNFDSDSPPKIWITVCSVFLISENYSDKLYVVTNKGRNGNYLFSKIS